MFYQKLKKRIKKHEGFSLKPYKDQLGFYTIGYGHLILSNEKNLIKIKKTKKQLEILFNQDFKRALDNYKKFLKKNTHNKKDEELLIEMVFQMGVKKVLMFRKLLKNMRNKKNYSVCFEMMSSLWYNQTPNRVKKLIKIFLSNERRR